MIFSKNYTLEYIRQAFKVIRVLLVSAFLTFSVGAKADDIDIYTGIFSAESAIGTSPAELNPNVMFILDDSGSMDSWVLVPVVGDASASYDSTVDYGGDGDALDDSYVYLYSDNMNYLDRYATIEQNKCQAQRDHVAALPDNPIFQDKFIQWSKNNRNKWKWARDWGTDNDSSRVIECRDDRGVHALTTTTISRPTNCKKGCVSAVPRYANTNPGGKVNPYKNNSNRKIVSGNYHDYLIARQLIIDASTSGTGTGSCNDEDQVLVDGTDIIGQCNRKLTVMKRAMNNALDSFKDVNIGLMDFNSNSSYSNSGGTQIVATGNINEPAFKTEFKAALDNMRAGGRTPLAESLYEAHNIFAGAARVFGEARDDNDGMDFTTNPYSYVSPIVNQCQSNNIVLLSDGVPVSDGDADSAISALLGAGNSCDSVGGTSESCLDDIAGYMASTDLSSGSNSVRGVNSVYTYTIGFNNDIAVLRDAADAGGPSGAIAGAGYFLADDILALENVFRRIIGQIQSVDADTFVAPAVTVNAYNRLQNREDIYYVVFKPNTNARWNGNLKKYKVTEDAVIEDANQLNAISETTGFFKDQAQSFWSTAADGPDVTSGGMGGQLDDNRALYGSLGAISDVTLTKLSDSASIAASVEKFLARADGIDIGVDTTLSAAEQTTNAGKIAAWTLGLDIDDDSGSGNDKPTNFVGDNIHGQPYVLSYGATEANPKDIIFFTSNQGMLHAVVGNDPPVGQPGLPGGSEAWAYVPDPSLLKNFGDYYNRTGDKVYGLDSEMAFDVRRDAVTNLLSKAVLYFGQRRGGNKVFAVDVEDAIEATSPVSKVWTIEGGTGDFERMGQTWGEPVVAKIRYCSSLTPADADGICPLKDVIILAGGYDTKYDEADVTVTAASLSGSVVGNAVYIVDASNGNMLWMAGSNVKSAARDLTISEMTHSIPSKPTVLDVNKDGAVDVIFLSDISGQVFRIDFKASLGDNNNVDSVNNTGKMAGGLIAKLADGVADRRFYNPLDVTLLPPIAAGAPARYALVTGSGSRANPLQAEAFGNRLSVVFDANIAQPAYDEDVNPSADLDTDREAYYLYAETGAGTSAIIDMSESTQALGLINAATTLDTAGDHKYGFYAEISGVGEKIITPTLISDFRAIAVSYLPDDGQNSTEACSSGVGTSNAYEFNLLSGEIAKKELLKPGLTAEPVVVYVLSVDPITGEESLRPIVIIGTEPFKGEDFGLTNLKLGKAEKRAWWEKGRAN
jgi:type IV pilus assembly protein PilY1